MCHYSPAIKTLGSILTTNDQAVIDRCLWSEFLEKLSVLIRHLLTE